MKVKFDLCNNDKVINLSFDSDKKVLSLYDNKTKILELEHVYENDNKLRFTSNYSFSQFKGNDTVIQMNSGYIVSINLLKNLYVFLRKLTKSTISELANDCGVTLIGNTDGEVFEIGRDNISDYTIITMYNKMTDYMHKKRNPVFMHKFNKNTYITNFNLDYTDTKYDLTIF